MEFCALACDYDGTLAHDGAVSNRTVDALERARAAGLRLILVTGRELKDLVLDFDRIDLFETMVMENGAVLVDGRSGHVRLLTDPPPAWFARELRARGVSPLYVGHVVVATVEPEDAALRDIIKEHGLDLELIFNKGSVMALPAGVNKASGLAEALRSMELSGDQVVGVGDAENDLAFLVACGLAVAVANALPSVREVADVVTEGARGDGVSELIDSLIEGRIGVGMAGSRARGERSPGPQ
jgi:hydroxymethylpyrimidine pyrophosphatase-like HAD family hydrolase